MNTYKLLSVSIMAAVLAACGGAEERKTAYMEKAEKSLEAGNLDKARIELKNVLQIDPKFDLAYYKLAEVQERKQNYKQAFVSFNKAAGLAPDNTEYQAKIGQYLLILGNDPDGAEEKLKLIQEKDKNDVHGLMLEAGIAAHREKYKEALEIADRVKAADPSNINNAVFIASVHQKQGNIESAVAALQEAARLNEYDHGLTSRIATYLVQLERFDEAEQALNSMLEADPDNYLTYVNLAKFHLRRDDTASAEDILRKAIARKPEDTKRRLELISMVENRRDLKSAMTVAREQIQESDDDGQIRLMLAELQIKDENPEGASRTLAKVIDLYRDDANSIRARLALTDLLIKKGDRDEARKTLDEALAISPNDDDVNMLKAQMSLADRDIEQGIISLRRVIKDNPEKLGAYLLLAGAHNANGEADQARNILAQAHENNRGNLPVLLQLAQNHMNAKRFEDAERVIDDYLRINDENYDALSIKAAVLNLARRSEAAEEYADELLKAYPDKVNGYVQKVPALLNQNKLDDAIQILSTGLEKTNDDMQLLALHTRLTISKGDIEKTASRIRQSIDKESSIRKYLLLTKIYSDNKQQAKAAEAIDEGIAKHPEYEDAYIIRARLHAAVGEMNKIEALLKDGIANASGNARLSMMLASMYDGNGEYDKARDVYRDMIKADPVNVVAKNNLAALLVIGNPSEDDINEALDVAGKIANVQQDAIQDTVAWVYYHAGKYAEAKEIMEPVIGRNADLHEFNFHYGMILYRLGDNTNAAIHLKKALDGDKNFRDRSMAESVYNQIS